MSETSPEKTDKKKWYVIHVHGQAEKKVRETLSQRIIDSGMEEMFDDEILVPIENTVEIIAGKKKTTKRKYLPGYIMVKMEMNDETWHLVKSIPKVSGFIGGSKVHPPSISDREVEELKQKMFQSESKPNPRLLYQVGQKIRVIEGPFQEFIGTVEDVNAEKAKLRVSVSIFGRDTPLELEFRQVEKN